MGFFKANLYNFGVESMSKENKRQESPFLIITNEI